MKFGFLNLAFALLASACLAQSNDTIRMGAMGRKALSYQFGQHHIAQFPLRALWADSAQGKSGLFYQNQSGNYRDNQTAENIRQFGIFSQGNRSLKKLRLEGYFSYRKSLDDSLGWNLGRKVSSMPYYFGIIKKGNWEKDLFDLGFNIGRPLLNNRFYIGLGAKYQLQKHARSNDTRVLIDYYYLDLALNVAYEVAAGHKIAVMGHRLSSLEKASARNYNDMHDSFGATEYNIHTLMGWGSFDLVRKTQYSNKANGWGGGLAYYAQLDNAYISNELAYSSTKSKFVRGQTQGSDMVENLIGTYTLNNWSNHLYLRYDDGRSINQLAVNLKWIDGRDLNQLYSGVNYLYDKKSLNLHYLLSPNRKKAFTLGFFMNWDRESKRDLNASHTMEISNLWAGLHFEKIFEGSKINFITAGGLAVRKNMSHNLSIGDGRENVISRSVIYPQYLFKKAPWFAPDIKLGLSKRFPKLLVETFLNYAIFITNKPDKNTFQSVYIPSGKRHSLSLCLNIYH